MNGIIGKKVGMTSMYNEAGKLVACTIVEAGPCVVTQVKTADTDGYDAVQLAFGEKKEKNTSKPLRGHFAKSGTAPKSKVVEFRGSYNVGVGDEVNLEMLKEGEDISVIGTSKGKGFQGVVKRHGFSGVGGQTHGQHNRGRAPGSIGACSTPSRVFKGMRMGGRMGNDRVKERNVRILKIVSDQNLLIVKGPVPGANGSYVIIEK